MSDFFSGPWPYPVGLLIVSLFAIICAEVDIKEGIGCWKGLIAISILCSLAAAGIAYYIHTGVIV